MIILDRSVVEIFFFNLACSAVPDKPQLINIEMKSNHTIEDDSQPCL